MAVTSTSRMLTSEEVCDLAEISYRQLDYWTRAGFLNPEPAPEPGQGHHRRWPPLEAYKVLGLAMMLRDGITLARAVQEISEGRVAHLVSRSLRDTIIDDLPPDSRTMP